MTEGLLTVEDMAILSAPFALADHEFLSGYTYISEEAIAARLDAVDPNWEFVLQQITTRDKQVVVVGRLTVKGVTRENTGMQKIIASEKGETGEPEKGATTDAFKRCARMFGIGRYILSIPKSNAERPSDAFLKWFNGLAKSEQSGNPAKHEPHWSQDATVVADLFKAAFEKYLLSSYDVLTALNVKTITQYTGTKEEAWEMCKAHPKAQPQAPAIPKGSGK